MGSIIMKKILYILVCLILVVSSCKKDDDVIAPPITAENTFSCKINGETFIPEDHGGFPIVQKGIIVEIFPESSNWIFQLRNSNKDIYIYIVNVLETGNYEIQVADGDGDFLFDTNNAVEASVTGFFPPTHVSTNISGNIEVIELDVDQRIILQFEELELVNPDDSSDIIVLTDGKLNINLETLN